MNMITKNDLILLLGELEEQGVDTSKMLEITIKYLLINPTVVKFINSHRPFDANKFYEKIRRSYNSKKSSLYINIMKEELPPDKMLTALCSYLLLGMLFSHNAKDTKMFLRHIRFDEVCKALLSYSHTFDLVPCIKLLQLIKADIKAFQYFTTKE